jgi:DNA polymerase I-like protein with 3'-5' exonuclease and polymerase domains
MKRSNDERVCINSAIQGTAGEFTIFALALLHNRLDPRVQIANSVHDSIILYCPDELLEETIELLRLTCENLPTEQYFGKSLRIGMKVDIETSKTHWGDLKS